MNARLLPPRRRYAIFGDGEGAGIRGACEATLPLRPLGLGESLPCAEYPYSRELGTPYLPWIQCCRSGYGCSCGCGDGVLSVGAKARSTTESVCWLVIPLVEVPESLV